MRMQNRRTQKSTESSSRVTIQLQQIEIGGLKWYVRPNSSDIKALKEVVEKKAYQKQGTQLSRGERWIDLGANIGAFTVLATSKGCEVVAYEPDPISYQITIENLKLNNLTAEVHNVAVINGKAGNAPFHVNSAKQNFWRNSLIKQWRGGKTIRVATMPFQDCLYTGAHIKMDIEGSEMPILENMDFTQIGNLIFEWSFDIDRSIPRFRNVIERAKPHFSSIRYPKFDETANEWAASWFPPCRTVHCHK